MRKKEEQEKEGRRERGMRSRRKREREKHEEQGGERDRSHIQSARVLTPDTTAQTLWRKEEGSQLAVW
eukprot:2797449-Rhodomonas_salina.1